MLTIEKDFTPDNDRLKKIILKKDTHQEAVSLALHLHALTHPAAASGSKSSFEDELLKDFTDADYRIGHKSFFPVAWQLWHLSRIEDITGNILIRNSEQIFNAQWQTRINALVSDTGNAMTNKEAAEFSQKINLDELQNYRIAVAKQSRETIKELSADDMHKKASNKALARIIPEGGLIEEHKSSWLVEFWGGKTFAGLVLLPFIRHQVMHIVTCQKLRKAIKG